MAYTAYVGLQGHGKTYEVVSTIIVPALRSGRRVVTNISGLKVDLIREFVGRVERFGELVQVPNAAINAPKFWDAHQAEEFELNEDNVVRAGDLVVLDEAWRFFGNDEKARMQHKVFVREHRHYADPSTGQTCDLVTITQDVSHLHREFRTLIETTFRMTKLVKLGIDKGYTVEVFEGWKLRDAYTVQTRRYDPRIFALYASYAHSQQGVEKRIDSRANMLRNSFFTIGIPVALAVGGMALWYVFHWFETGGGYIKKKPLSAASGIEVKKDSSTPGMVAAPRPGPGASSRWRMVGTFVHNGAVGVILANAEGDTRVVNDPQAFKFGRLEQSIIIDGEYITPYGVPTRRGAVLGGK